LFDVTTNHGESSTIGGFDTTIEESDKPRRKSTSRYVLRLVKYETAEK